MKIGLLYFAQDAHVAHWMRNICARKFHAQHFRKLGLSFVNAQYMRKICTDSLPNARYMRNLCTTLHFSPQCAIYVQDLLKIVLLSPTRKIVLFSPMCNICTKFVQDCTCARPSHHLCTQHNHSAGHKIFYFLIKIDRSLHTIRKRKSNQMFFL